ncbi:hypothetical protein R1flu_007223 [Riccia fluitans]|uniref:Uncharacterized protein n=1 Tax=Riccia fluitans TaxID=41844 RepID=A0ABD1YZC7_9MARC
MPGANCSVLKFPTLDFADLQLKAPEDDFEHVILICGEFEFRVTRLFCDSWRLQLELLFGVVDLKILESHSTPFSTHTGILDLCRRLQGKRIIISRLNFESTDLESRNSLLIAWSLRGYTTNDFTDLRAIQSPGVCPPTSISTSSWLSSFGSRSISTLNFVSFKLERPQAFAWMIEWR